MNFRNLNLVLSVLAVSALSVPAQAYEPKKDWPCIQVKVPELSPAMMWAGPELSGPAVEWSKSPNAAATARKLIVRRYGEEQVAQFVADFAKQLAGDERQVEMTRLFAASFDLVAAERREVIAGIERFTKRQRELADNVRKTRAELEVSLKNQDPSDKQLAERREIEERLNWQTRIFDDREKSTRFVCEVPTLLEKRLFLIAREVANNIDG
ncbi:hypothetical protein [Anderseniella sp. Alg231-50]|uniref:hypothetical protein n=1 Tax=Anderseniella sp. Alg231-50 TaxID=1922226 RepID=UPI000D55D2D9